MLRRCLCMDEGEDHDNKLALRRVGVVVQLKLDALQPSAPSRHTCRRLIPIAPEFSVRRSLPTTPAAAAAVARRLRTNRRRTRQHHGVCTSRLTAIGTNDQIDTWSYCGLGHVINKRGTAIVRRDHGCAKSGTRLIVNSCSSSRDLTINTRYNCVSFGNRSRDRDSMGAPNFAILH